MDVKNTRKGGCTSYEYHQSRQGSEGGKIKIKKLKEKFLRHRLPLMEKL